MDKLVDDLENWFFFGEVGFVGIMLIFIKEKLFSIFYCK